MKRISRLTFKAVFGVIFIIFFYTSGYSQSHQLADKYWNEAEAFAKQNKHLQAAKLYEKSAEAEELSPITRLNELLTGRSTSMAAIRLKE